VSDEVGRDASEEESEGASAIDTLISIN